MKKNQKLIAYGAGGLILVFLLYRWYASRSAAGTAATDQLQTNPTDQASSDYASLAGTEQADVAALQAHEQQDLAGLGGQEATDIAGLGSQEQSDFALLGAQIAGLGGTLASLTAADQAAHNQVAAGQAKPPGPPKTPPGFAFGRTQPHAPAGHHYVGVGAGWWKLVKGAAAQASAGKANPHSSNHQAGNPGHTGSAPAGHAVAPSSHAPKPTTIRKPSSGGAATAPKAAAKAPSAAASRPPSHKPEPTKKPPRRKAA